MESHKIRSLIAMLIVLGLILSGCGLGINGTQDDSTTLTPDSVAWLEDYCTMVSSDQEPAITPGDTTQPLVPVANSTDWIDGPETAEVTIIEYADFQCPGCAAMAPILKQLRQEYPDSLRIVFRHFPNPIHDKALLASQAAEAAGLQGKFWLMHEELFAMQSEWSLLTTNDFPAWLLQTASAIGLDPDRFIEEYQSPAIKVKVNAAGEAAFQLGIPYTPFLVINGTMWQGPREYQSIKDVVALLLLEQRQVTGCPPFSIDLNKQYLATIVTNKGSFVIQLYPAQSPLAVNNFVFLARRGFYNGIPFHRVIPGYLIQSGDPSGTGYGGPGYSFPIEIDPTLTFDQVGMVGLANAGPDTNGSQFFITLRQMHDLDGKYTIFGQVIQGMEVVLAVASETSSQDMAATQTQPDMIMQISITEK